MPSSSYEYYPVTLPEPQYESYVTGGILAILIVGAVAIGLPIGIFLQKKNNISLREQQFAILIACTTAVCIIMDIQMIIFIKTSF